MLNAFVWSVRPELEGTPMTSEWIYSEKSSGEYLDRSMLPAIRAHNKGNANARQFGRGLGLFLSTFEMKNLLLAETALLAVPKVQSPRNVEILRACLGFLGQN